ncbi:Phosphoenolpyruvate synthase regulatory protein [Andreprevotia sp. IGB-42]|uniref:posphoenolpyruvate synthetase regulatory kinase/phosphorylase PpsR n=1 Tax=Andreprevotia sp. IGB-42 TaxID=2497473 RepID=UPI0013590BB0|nr:pyruvate, water dikinase regulatory protein [Andreprevotia sp. IGB-42]KAF0813224.1 Phosphoenolpyruvate synthase regulatory protein [Andreprevotia sp. IGB-42]
MPRTAFFVSARTAITAEMLGHSLTVQFEGVDFRRITLPYIDTREKAHAAVAQIREQARIDGCRPMVFSTLIDEDLRSLFQIDEALVLDFFGHFIGPMEQELGLGSTHLAGKVHGIASFEEYKNRIDAIQYAMSHDDGSMAKNLAEADIILVGVSRAGKTPACLYLALQYGIKAANYPLAPEDFDRHTLPKPLHPHRTKLFGLTIEPERLTVIRESRKPGSQYATLAACQHEVTEAENLMRQLGIVFLNTTKLSIEELATNILLNAGLKRRIH